MHEHRFGEHEAADEQEDDGIGKRRERVARRYDAQRDGEDRPDEGRHRKRQRLGDPEDDHHRHDRRQAMSRGLEREGRDEQRQEDGGTEEQPDGPTPAVE